MTGLIYMAIIAVWAVILVPGWLHRHDRRQLGYRNPRVSAFMSRMAARTSVLGIPLHGSAQDADLDVDALDPAADAPRSRGRRARRGRRGHRGRHGRREPRARRSAVGRRRIVLTLIMLAVVGVAVAAAAGLLPMLALTAPATLLLCFLVLMRTQVSRSNRRRARAARRGALGSGDAADAPAPSELPTLAPGTWEPRSTPLPRYVTAAREQAALAEAERVEAELATAPRARSGGGRATTRPSQRVWTAAAMLERAQRERAQQERTQQEQQQAAAEARAGIQRQAIGEDDRDEAFLREQAAGRPSASSPLPFRRASNE